MTSPRPETTARSEQPEEKPQGAQLSATQVAAGALAAVSSAVVASFFGLAGTLIGAALASVISTVTAALYSNSLQRTNEKLRQARRQLTERQAVVAENGRAPATQVLPAHLDPRRAAVRRLRPRWATVAVYAAAVFVMAMGIVTGIELIGQRPVSALVGATETSTTTTLGAITHVSPSSEEPDEDPSTPSSPTTTTAPATGSSTPATTSGEESTREEDEGSNSEESSSSATPTRTSQAEPTTDSEPSESPTESSGDSPQEDTSPSAGAAPSP